jgi:hypothetical protein
MQILPLGSEIGEVKLCLNILRPALRFLIEACYTLLTNLLAAACYARGSLTHLPCQLCLRLRIYGRFVGFFTFFKLAQVELRDGQEDASIVVV